MQMREYDDSPQGYIAATAALRDHIHNDRALQHDEKTNEHALALMWMWGWRVEFWSAAPLVV